MVNKRKLHRSPIVIGLIFLLAATYAIETVQVFIKTDPGNYDLLSFNVNKWVMGSFYLVISLILLTTGLDRLKKRNQKKA